MPKFFRNAFAVVKYFYIFAGQKRFLYLRIDRKMLKILYRQVGKYKLAALLTPLFTALEVVMDVLIPWVTARLIDLGINAGDMKITNKPTTKFMFRIPAEGDTPLVVG